MSVKVRKFPSARVPYVLGCLCALGVRVPECPPGVQVPKCPLSAQAPESSSRALRVLKITLGRLRLYH